ncbi:hypothetical protein F4782DRAFT_548845 [Xylaria castorea]|nr:hypothetical protein F4782DRAFT_548845 [Xylaria castorea]
MSYWSTNSGAAGHSGPSYDPPPLPPRNNGRGPIEAPDAAPPPIPPRPVGFGYQPVRDSGPPESPNQSTGLSPRIHITPGRDGDLQHSSSRPGVSPNQTQSYSDISHLFPDGKIPPPPPRLGVSPSPQPPLNAGKPDTGVSPAVFQPQLPTNDEIPRTYSEGNKLQNQTQQSFSPQTTPTSVSADHREHADITKDWTIDANTHDARSNLAREAGNMQGVAYVTVSDDIVTMNTTFQSMGIGNSSDITPEKREERSNINYHAYSLQQPSNPSPNRPAKLPLPTQQTPSARSPAANASITSPRQPQTVAKECISTNVTFAATWYTHPRTPEFHICMNCYENHIRGSRFKDNFQGTFCDDGKPRGCSFNSIRIKESLWKPALLGGSLESLVDYMILRPFMQDCLGQGGAKAGSGIKWYRTRNSDIPAMAVCQACYEDHILAYPKFGQDHFEPFDASIIQQVADQTWSCDIAVPYIYREYKVRASTNDWRSFVQGVPVRMSLEPCPGEKTVYPDGKGKKWFTPVGGPQGLLICGACYCDYILLTGQEGRLQDAGEDLVNLFGVSVSCFFGPQYNVRVLAGRMLDTSDYALFWKAIDIVAREPRCKGRIQNATWYTLHSNPDGFEICRACYVTIAEPMGVGHHFKPKTGIPPESSTMCSFNTGIARFPVYMNKLLEMIYKQDPTPLEEFVKEYAFMPQCRRDTYVENARWFGWKDCTICAECHHEFIRGTALADSIPHQGTHVEGAVMCEMYSPRMRQLYLATCTSDPPDPKPLLEYSVQRRAVWAQTMPRARQILSDIRLKMLQQSTAMNNSMFYSWSGNLWQNTLPLEQTYSNSAIGYGHYNHMQIQGAEYGRQAAALGNEIRGSPAYVADELERQWRLVE